MAFRVERDFDGCRYRLIGELDLAVSEELLTVLSPSMEAGGDIRLDVAQLEFIDSSGLRALLKLCARLGERGRVVLESPMGEVAKVLKVVRADTFPHLVIEDGRVLR
ncbi:MAG TPA: STAS domain-containing protein [Actinomycetota bacterium]|nr:STAS domain-containing protein [Actinomycetota bacterium]